MDDKKEDEAKEFAAGLDEYRQHVEAHIDEINAQIKQGQEHKEQEVDSWWEKLAERFKETAESLNETIKGWMDEKTGSNNEQNE